MQKESLVVLFGGRSNESEISVITGALACSALKGVKESVLPVYMGQDGEFYADDCLADVRFFRRPDFSKIKRAIFSNGNMFLITARGKIKGKIKVKCIINCCHGGVGENGAISGLASACNIPLASASVAESAILCDKYLTKLFAKSIGVKTAPYVYLKNGYCEEELQKIEYPCVVKPCALGSSIGVVKVDDESALKSALDVAFLYDDGVIVEKFLDGKRELNCACYRGENGVVASEIEEVFSSGDLLSYDDKYAGQGKREMPAKLDEITKNKVKDTAKKIYSYLNMHGIVRFDFFLCGKKIYLIEGNAVPGSLSNYLLSNSQKEFGCLLQRLVAVALREREQNNAKMIVSTGILNNFMPSNACKLK